MANNSRIKKFISKTSLLILPIIVALAFPSKPEAAVRCEIQYGGREVCIRTGQIQVNKKVWDPSQKSWIDNSDYKFSPGSTIEFSIEVKNSGDNTLSSVTLSDILPSFLVLSSGSLNEEIKDLTPGKTETRKINAKVKAIADLPKDITTNCDVNIAEATSTDSSDKDTTRVCYSKHALKILPKAGANTEISVLLLFTSTIAGLLGMSLIRKSLINA